MMGDLGVGSSEASMVVVWVEEEGGGGGEGSDEFWGVTGVWDGSGEIGRDG